MSIIIGELEDAINVVTHFDQNVRSKYQTASSNLKKQSEEKITKELDAALNLQKFDELKNASVHNLASTTELIMRMNSMEDKFKRILISYVYRNFIYKDLFEKYQGSKQYKIDNTDMRDVNREKYLEWLKE
jgi:hypothetical protein